MTRVLLKLKVLLFLFLLIGFIQSSTIAEENIHTVWAIKDCRIVAIGSPTIAKGNIVIRNGLIEQAGANAKIPLDAEIIDGSGLTVYPGFIDALNRALLSFPREKAKKPAQKGSKKWGVTPETEAFDYVKISNSILKKYHRSGITAVQILPTKGILTGRSAVISLSSPEKNRALIPAKKYLGIGFEHASRGNYPTSLMGVVALLRQEFTDAGYYSMHLNKWRNLKKKITRPAFDRGLEILSEYSDAKKPLIFLCRNQHDILRALRLAKEFKLNSLIADLGGEAFRLIPELEKARSKVLIAVSFKIPSTSIYAKRGRKKKEQAEKEIYPKNAEQLAKAGIPFAFASIGTDDPVKFMKGIEKSVSAGLPIEKALMGLTKNSASMLGLSEFLGTIAKGKIANLVITEGELFQKESKIKYVFADGKKFEVKSKKAGKKPAVNVSGKWELTFETGMASGMKVLLELKQDGSEISGKITSGFGAGEISDGSISDNEISITVTISSETRSFEIAASATVEGDTMRGELIIGSMGSTEFSGRKLP